MGVDPGATTGWCLWDSESKTVAACGEFAKHLCSVEFIVALDQTNLAVVEGFSDVHAGIYPETVQPAVTCGRLLEFIERRDIKCQEISRMETKRQLELAIRKEFRVLKDKDVWGALQLLHGPGSADKPRVKKGVEVTPGGVLARVRDHARAALAVAVAWHHKFESIAEIKQ